MWQEFARRVQYGRGSLAEEWGVARSLLVVGCLVLTVVGAQAVGASNAVAAIIGAFVMVLVLVLLVPSEDERNRATKGKRDKSR